MHLLRSQTAKNPGQERRIYLSACRILQWNAERLPVDERSCTMRGMNLVDWCHARNLLVESGILTNRMVLRTSIVEAMPILSSYWQQLGELRAPAEPTTEGPFLQTRDGQKDLLYDTLAASA